MDFSGATDVSAIADLDGAPFTLVNKTLLWERYMGTTGTHNFEGITPGPQLGDGTFSMLLIADNNTGTQQHLYPLVIEGVVPEPIRKRAARSDVGRGAYFTAPPCSMARNTVSAMSSWPAGEAWVLSFT